VPGRDDPSPSSSASPNRRRTDSVSEVVFAQALDAIIVTDADITVTAWNPAAEGLYGISEADALGRNLDDLLDVVSLDGTSVAADVSQALRSVGRWTGTIVQRPPAGERAGLDVIVDTHITALRTPDGEYNGAISFNRDITARARLEAEHTTLASIALATGRARSRAEVADASLEVLCRATGADAGLIMPMDHPFEVVGQRGLSPTTVDLIGRYEGVGDRLRAAIEPEGAAVTVAVDQTPIGAALKAAIAADGLTRVSFAGMRIGGRLIGVLGLGWRSAAAATPSGGALLQAATLVASALENARLLDQVAGGLELERSLTLRLQTLVELTRLSVDAADPATFASHVLDRIVPVLGAVTGSVVHIDGDQMIPAATFGMTAEQIDHRNARPLEEWGFYRRLAAGSGAFIEAIAESTLPADTLAIARDAGFQAYAVLPIRDGDQLVAILFAQFQKPLHEIPIDDRTLEAIGRILDISFANQRLRGGAIASEGRYRALFERSPDALLVQSLDDVVVDANPAARALFGDGVVGVSVARLADIGAADLESQRGRVLAGETVGWSGVGRRLDGTTFQEEVEARRVEIAGEVRILALVRDTTERDRFQQEMNQAQKMEALGLLVSGVAHELNNPLASIVAFSQLLRTDPGLPDDLHRQADMLIQEATRTRRIVQNFLDFARQRPPERVRTSIRELVDGVLELQSYTFGPNRIEARVDIPDDLPDVSLDRAQIQQMLINLTLNAAQAIKGQGERGSIAISAQESIRGDGAPVVRLTISDDGPGVPEELRSRLFVPFFTTRPPGLGTGLGLSVSFGIATGHGGTLRHEPGPGGRGASFIVELPIRPATGPPGESPPRTRAAAASDSAPIAAESTAPKRVLVLDDEPAIRDFLGRILRRSGHEPVLAADGRAALEVVRTDPPDAILCDHRMAGMSGTTFHDAVAEIDPELAKRFVFMSGDVMNPVLSDFATSRGVTLLAKPFDIESVDRVLADLFAAADEAPGG
jgi:PAS domain S-box-containing protein